MFGTVSPRSLTDRWINHPGGHHEDD